MKFMQHEVHELAKTKGFWPKGRSFAECVVLIHSELSEALEADRLNDKEAMQEELADTVIRIMDLAEHLNIDLEEQIWRKHLKNQRRQFKHGKAY